MSEWTKEPWPVPDVAAFNWSREYTQLNGGALSLADFIRAKACVDACVGMSDPAEEIARLRSAVAELSHDSVTFQGQREALRDALKALYDASEGVSDVEIGARLRARVLMDRIGAAS